MSLDENEDESDELHIDCTLEQLHMPSCVGIVAAVEERHLARFVYPSDGEYISVLVQAEQLSGGRQIELTRDHVIANQAEVYRLNNNDTIESVTFPRDFTFGQKWTLIPSYCSNLKSVTLPETVAELDQCFQSCEKLEHVELPDSLLAISNLSFVDCPALTEIRFPKLLYQVDQSCFHRTGLRVIVSDSIHSKRLFNRYAHIPMMINGETNTALRLYLLALYVGMSVSSLIDSKKQYPFYLWTDVTTIYITEQVKPFDIEGFTQVDSDRAGYRRYNCHWGLTDRMKLMSKELTRRKAYK